MKIILIVGALLLSGCLTLPSGGYATNYPRSSEVSKYNLKANNDRHNFMKKYHSN